MINNGFLLFTILCSECYYYKKSNTERICLIKKHH